MNRETKIALNLNYAILAFIGIYVFFGQAWALSVAEWTSNIVMTFATLIVTLLTAALFYFGRGDMNLSEEDKKKLEATREKVREAYTWTFARVASYAMVAFFVGFYYTEGLLYTSAIHLVGFTMTQVLGLRTKYLLNMS